MPFKRILVIMNPVSGQQDPDAVTELIEARAAQAGAELEIRRTEGEGDAEGWAKGPPTKASTSC